MIGRDYVSNRRNSLAMWQRDHPKRFGAIGCDYFHGWYREANHGEEICTAVPKIDN
jgi:hypothetical protein